MSLQGVIPVSPLSKDSIAAVRAYTTKLKQLTTSRIAGGELAFASEPVHRLAVLVTEDLMAVLRAGHDDATDQDVVGRLIGEAGIWSRRQDLSLDPVVRALSELGFRNTGACMEPVFIGKYEPPGDRAPVYLHLARIAE